MGGSRLMPRGQAAEVGDTNVAANGYHYTRTESGWRLTHHLIAERGLGRKLTGQERVVFVDGDRTNLDPANLEVKTKTKGKANRVHYLKTKMELYKEELEELGCTVVLRISES